MTQHAFQPIPSAALQDVRASELAHRSPEVIGLWVEYPTGRSSFLTFPSAFDRGLMVIALSSQSLNLRPVTYR